MSSSRTIAAINDKIARQQVTVWTVAELKERVAATSVAEAFAAVDVITTGTFEPVESAGAILNLGHTDPPMKIRQCWLDGVAAYAGLGAVDLYLGATVAAESNDPSDRKAPVAPRGGGHVIEDLIAGKAVQLRAVGYGTDCYPRTSFETTITRKTINQFSLFNPRNLYQNFIVGVNAGDRPLHTYLGP
ncbi:MAG: homocysteine biosynthesis protein, partial [Cyanobacteria bacterium J06641_5]